MASIVSLPQMKYSYTNVSIILILLYTWFIYYPPYISRNNVASRN
jgi:hypothetical protein